MYAPMAPKLVPGLPVQRRQFVVPTDLAWLHVTALMLCSTCVSSYSAVLCEVLLLALLQATCAWPCLRWDLRKDLVVWRV